MSSLIMRRLYSADRTNHHLPRLSEVPDQNQSCDRTAPTLVLNSGGGGGGGGGERVLARDSAQAEVPTLTKRKTM